MNKKLLTLCLLLHDDQILLGMKKRGFGAGKWNGFGGKAENGETIIAAAKREVYEECGIEVLDLQKQGILDFVYADNTDELLEVHIFKAVAYTGKPVETAEMRPKWFSLDSIPYEAMWADDSHWLPLLLAEKFFKGKFSFAENNFVLNSYLVEVGEADLLR